MSQTQHDAIADVCCPANFCYDYESCAEDGLFLTEADLSRADAMLDKVRLDVIDGQRRDATLEALVVGIGQTVERIPAATWGIHHKP